MSPSCSRTPSTAANRFSNSASSSVPSSRSKSRPRASGSCMNASRTRACSSPSASQKLANDAKTFVVRTPPKSTSSPLRVATERRLLGAVRELQDALAEPLEVRVVGGAGDRPLVVALHEHDRLPQRERLVPADVGHRPAAALLVAGDELGAAREAL